MGFSEALGSAPPSRFTDGEVVREEERETVGMLMEFFVGDKRRIGEGFSSRARIPLWQQPFVVAWADFSLHLSPIDLDLFSEEVCRMAGVEPVTLTASLTEKVGGNGRTSSADVVSPQWVEMIAGVLDHQVEELAERWLVRAAEEHHERPGEPNEDTLRAIRELVEACQIASEKRLSVVHTWSL
jgi:hypothetical protein